MGIKRDIKARTKRRVLRSTAKRALSARQYRVAVFRSLKHMYAQLIDDVNATTVASASSVQLESLKGNKTDVAYAIGKELAKRAQEVNVQAVVFDRRAYRFHGRVKALAQGLRDGGLTV